MKKILLSIALAAVCAFAVSAPKTHDGFFLNGTAGFGYGNYLNEFKTDGVKLESKGFQITSGLKIGGAIIPNLILHATLKANSIIADISVSNNAGESVNIPLNNEAYKVVLFGAGVTYYLPSELNIFLSASAGIASYTEFCTLGESISKHDEGFSFNLSVGKEWWVNDELGLGVAFSFNHSSTNSDFLNYKGDVSFNSLSIEATLTFN